MLIFFVFQYFSYVSIHKIVFNGFLFSIPFLFIVYKYDTLNSFTCSFIYISQNKSSLYSYVCLIVCCLGYVVRPNWEIFTHLETTIISEGLQILTYTWQSWPLSIEGSLTCLTYCDKDHPFITVTSDEPWHTHLLQSIWQWCYHYLF